MVLVRHHLGGVLRRQRMRQKRTLRQVSAAAQVSLGYLSEVERGQKEASSELLASIASALDVPLSELLQEVGKEVARAEGKNVPEVPDTPEVLAPVRPRVVSSVTSTQVETRRLEPTGRRPEVVASAA